MLLLSCSDLAELLKRLPTDEDRRSTLAQLKAYRTKKEALKEARRRLREDNDPTLLIKVQWPDAIWDEFQLDMIRSLFDPSMREIFVKGCTASGKTAVAGMLACLYFDAYEDSKVVLTSSTFDHVQSVLFGEVARWYKAMQFKPEGSTLNAEGIGCNEKHFVACVNPSNNESFSGRHSRHTLFLFDESTAIPDERFTMADTQCTKFMALANPRTLSGKFRLAFGLNKDPNACETVLGPYGQRRCITIDGAQVLNVREKRLENAVGPIGGITIKGREYKQGQPIPEEDYELVKPLLPGQLCYDTFLGHCANPDHRWVNTFARGKFPDEDPQLQVMLSSWMQRHVLAWQDSQPGVNCFGFDVAASEFGDESVVAAGSAAGCRELHVRQQASTMETVAWVLGIGLSYGIDLKRGEIPVVIDADGLGKPVGDRLQELGVKVVFYRGNDKPDESKRYVNRRAEAYSVLGARLDPNGSCAATPWALPPDSLLHQDLCAPEKIYDSDGFRYKLTPKTRQPGMPTNRATLAEKLGRSPDRGDAVVLLYWGVHMGDNIAVSGVSRWDISQAAKHDVGAPLPGNLKQVVGALYQNPQRGRLAFAVLGLIVEPPTVRLLRCEQYPPTLTMNEKAEAVRDVCLDLNVSAVAVDFTQNQWLLDRLRGKIQADCYNSVLDPEMRRDVAGNLIRRFKEQSVEILRDESLANEIALLPIKESAQGYTLEDDQSLAVMDRAMAFAIGLRWASLTLLAWLEEP